MLCPRESAAKEYPTRCLAFGGALLNQHWARLSGGVNFEPMNHRETARDDQPEHGSTSKPRLLQHGGGRLNHIHTSYILRRPHTAALRNLQSISRFNKAD